MLIGDILSVFKQGKALENASVWQSRTALTNALVGLLTGVAGVLYGFGVIHVQVDSDTIQAIALGAASVWGVANSVMHVATSDKAGLPAGASVQPASEAADKSAQRDTSYVN